ncbi:MAG: DUF4258 domain-containing protein [Ferruginibacter sp.]
MLKKYLPFLLFIAAAVLLYFIKTKQRGEKKETRTSQTINAEPINRDTNILVYSKHALCRIDCRHIDEEEVKDIVATGSINYSKVEEDEKGVTYPLEGITKDKQYVRVVIAPKKNETVIVTVIDLEKDWTCSCN